VAACRSSSNNIRKINLIPVLKKTSPQAHTKLELDVLVFTKTCEICSSLIQKKKMKNYIFFFTPTAQIEIDQFLVSRNFRD
jgi:formamidopyrimidine-DNA glycosylase